MNARSVLLTFVSLLAGFIAINGCTTTGASREGDPPAGEIIGEQRNLPADTGKPVDRVIGQPATESHAGSLPRTQSGKFTIQIGAYQEREGAERIAEIAKGRLSLPVEVLEDPVQRLYKVFVGRFQTKEEARNFRDDLIQRYPGDYTDAWVNELQEQ